MTNDQPHETTTDVDTSADETTSAPDGSAEPVIEHGEIVNPPIIDEEATETVTAPAKVMRIGSMVKQLLEEVKASDLDEESRERLAEIYERSIAELSVALSPDLQHELHMLTLPFKDGVAPSSGEIRVAHAQLVGWLEGLFHGIQATLFAQQLAARQQLEQMRGIPAGSDQGIDPRLLAQQPGAQQGPGNAADRPGTYL
ncbi:MAG: bacterial proteasome activator family protein [Ilumatobacteraceae bacterium]